MNRNKHKSKRAEHRRERAATRAALAGGRTRLIQPEKWRRRPTLPPVTD